MGFSRTHKGPNGSAQPSVRGGFVGGINIKQAFPAIDLRPRTSHVYPVRVYDATGKLVKVLEQDVVTNLWNERYDHEAYTAKYLKDTTYHGSGDAAFRKHRKLTRILDELESDR